MELRQQIAALIRDYAPPDSFADTDAEELADRILSLEPIAQALNLTVGKTMENR
jgi:hypothetical protein